MSSTEAPFSVTVKNAHGHLYTLRGGNFEDFRINLAAALGQAEADAFLADYAGAFTGTFTAATRTIAAAVPVTTVAQPSTVGGVPAQPLPQPSAPSGDIPPDVTDPGPCAHGARKYRDSMARGRQWRRFECALDWQKGNDAHNAQRCKAVNV